MEYLKRREFLWLSTAGIAIAGCGKSEELEKKDSGRSQMKYVRLYVGPDGESHFEDVELEMPMGDIGTANVPRVAISQPFSVSKILFIRVEVGLPEQRDVSWHTAPDRRFVIWLEGESEQEASDGEIRRFGPGDVFLAEDTTGKGHRSRNLSDGLLAMIPLTQ